MEHHARRTVALLVLLLAQGCAIPRVQDWLARPAATPGTELKIWAHSDLQPRDGGEYRAYTAAVSEMSALGTIDLAVVAGDLVHDPRDDRAYRWYLARTRGSTIPHWYEIAGNHEAWDPAHYRRHLGDEIHRAVQLGNLRLLLLSSEVRDRRPAVSAATFAWWHEQVRTHQDQILITVTHACPTQSGLLAAGFDGLTLQDSERFAAVLREQRVDLWLCGHSHLAGWLPGKEHVAEELGGTLFVDVSAIRPHPLTESESRVLLFRPGAREVLVRTRSHERERYLRTRDVLFELAHEFEWDGAPPVVTHP